MSEPARPIRILLVEDDPDDVFLVEHALARGGHDVSLQVCGDGEAAAAYVTGAPPYEDRARFAIPDLVILDLKLPRVDGFEVLARLRSAPGGRDVPVVVHSSSWEARDIDRAYRLGANVYVAKQVDLARLVDLVTGMVSYARVAALEPG